jgi:hypothetical protein
MITSGVIKRKTSVLPLTKVTGLRYLRTVGRRVLGYGTIRVEPVGQKQDIEKFEYVPKPEAVFNMSCELVSREPLSNTALEVDRLGDSN